MNVELIVLSEIDVKGRARPISEEDVKWLAADISDRKLRSPIEVARKSKGGYRLVSGFHRYSSCKLLGMEAIPAIIVEGTKEELERDELLENLARKELTALDRSIFISKLKKVHIKINRTKRGGDRKSAEYKEENQTATLANWFDEVSKISGKGVRTLERSASIGEKICPQAVANLRGSIFEDNQKQLEALSKLPPEEQCQITELMTVEHNPAKSVNQARDLIEGRSNALPALTPSEKKLEDLKKAWAQGDDGTHQDFLNWLMELGVSFPSVELKAA
ncbi:ParB N-terminal domain-containing protein [uncultured Kiloniella sp.]|uniref:ParB/RepB/Spo0J family partition protein n=1 Tax=uncultured Kiloniella sp. TaxID=1133091 RepID=UPI002639D20D|nr:ParB N-terminal domain-containing protein [uncultured Kiloniella sp.]